jgi:hypothetical protein
LISRRAGIVLLAVVTMALVIAAMLAPRIAQPVSYHQFAAHRSWLGIANFGDVASNILFA